MNDMQQTAGQPAPDCDACARTGEAAAPGSVQPVSPDAQLWPPAAMPPGGSSEPVRAVCFDEFEQLCRDGALACLRELRSLGYSVSLLFHAPSPGWYVASWQDATLWRVAWTASCEVAQGLFAHLADEIVQLCGPDLRRIELDARNTCLSSLVAQAEAEVARLRDSLQRAATQSQLAAARQQKTRRDIVRLDSHRIAAQTQLTQTLRQVAQLRLAASSPCAPPGRPLPGRK
ncbi:DUF2968 domain-containing protein [Paraburkholderia kururiensis]|uniref:DUF2968 domain-containing protein n=1 Tax=Paraburkholderia kururiensis TaxID=984307 RepID=UPI00138716EB|nr:DUF2968 domain-containing protein [Paraburkholderia kururiensis]